MRFAYADPPYIGQAKRHYSHDPRCAEVDHVELITRLRRDYDAWALSASSPTIVQIARLKDASGEYVLPTDTRIHAWVKPFASFKPGVNPAYTWEPIFVHGGRKRGRDIPTLRDYVETDEADCVKANITLKKGLSGAKPPKVCDHIFGALNVQSGDVFDDLFPGTGIVSASLVDYLGRVSA